MGSDCCKTYKPKEKHVNKRNERALYRGYTMGVLERLEYNKIAKVNSTIEKVVYQAAYGTHNYGARVSLPTESFPYLQTLPQETLEILHNEAAYDSLSEPEEEESEGGLCKLPSYSNIKELQLKPYSFELRNLLINDQAKSPEVKGDLSLCKALSKRLSINIQNINQNSRQLENLRKEYSNSVINTSEDSIPRWSE